MLFILISRQLENNDLMLCDSRDAYNEAIQLVFSETNFSNLKKNVAA